jgi:hypothetical protein
MDILSANKSMAGGGAGVIIHIIDTGVNPVPELKPVLSVIPFLSGKTAQDGGTSSGGGLSGENPDPFAAYDYYDHIGHGTMMAVCAHRQAPDALIYSYCALPDSVRAYVNEALTYIADHLDRSKKHIVSMSFRGQGDLTDAYPTAMHNAIKRLVSMGVACVCASGNDGQGTLDKYPACFQEPFTIAAVDSEGKHAGFSNWPDETDFAELGKTVPCRNLNGRETVCDGTSPATAVVAGKLACMWSKNLTLTEPQLYEAAKKNCLDLGTTGRDAYYGYGWIAKMDVSTAPEPKPEPKRATLRVKSPYMTGADVKMAQERLNVHGYKVDNDGIYGRMTAAAVTAFQKAQGLVADGICGAKTWAALELEPTDKAARFIAWLKGRVGDIYVWGGQGETNITEAWIRKKETSTGNANRAIALWNKRKAEGRSPIGAWDCSGLITAWLLAEGLIKADTSSRGLWKLCTGITRAELVPGDLLFRKNALGIVHHVGVYIGGGEVIEARGREYGVVQRGINASGADYWTHAGRLGVLK